MIFSILAVKIGDITTISWEAQLTRFFTFSDSSIQLAIMGALLLGLTCGLLGSFLVTRQQALYGDTLAHAVLPGIALAFIFTFSKESLPLLIGGLASALLAALFFEKLKNSTVIKMDCAMGLSLAGFYGVGIGLLTMIQNVPNAQQAGLDKFLFGQAAALSPMDIKLMGIACLCIIIIIVFFYKQLLATSFDPLFARIIGIKVSIFNGVLTVLTAITIVISIKAVGVVLVSAMLIVPAATAILLVKRFHYVLMVSSGIGMVSGVLGTLVSFIKHNLPTGPFMVVVAIVVFSVVFLFQPHRGLIAIWRKRHDQSVH